MQQFRDQVFHKKSRKRVANPRELVENLFAQLARIMECGLMQARYMQHILPFYNLIFIMCEVLHSFSVTTRLVVTFTELVDLIVVLRRNITYVLIQVWFIHLCLCCHNLHVLHFSCCVQFWHLFVAIHIHRRYTVVHSYLLTQLDYQRWHSRIMTQMLAFLALSQWVNTQ